VHDRRALGLRGLAADRVGHEGLVQVGRFPGLREDAVPAAEDQQGDRVGLLLLGRQVGPERGLEGQGAEPPAQRRDAVAVSRLREVAELQLELLRLAGGEEMAERLELLIQGIELGRRTGPCGLGGGHPRTGFMGGQARHLLLNQVDGLGQVLVGMA
jgi:hypothetical protein